MGQIFYPSSSPTNSSHFCQRNHMKISNRSCSRMIFDHFDPGIPGSRPSGGPLEPGVPFWAKIFFPSCSPTNSSHFFQRNQIKISNRSCSRTIFDHEGPPWSQGYLFDQKFSMLTCSVKFLTFLQKTAYQKLLPFSIHIRCCFPPRPPPRTDRRRRTDGHV